MKKDGFPEKLLKIPFELSELQQSSKLMGMSFHASNENSKNNSSFRNQNGGGETNQNVTDVSRETIKEKQIIPTTVLIKRNQSLVRMGYFALVVVGKATNDLNVN
jgi:hypothetical protein